MRPEIALQTMRDRRALTAALAGYLVLLVGVMTIFWPAVRDSADLQSFVRDLPAGVKALIGDADYATAAGFLSAELFSLMVPLLMLVAAIGLGARAIAGEEEAGTIDLLLSLPITRRRVLVEKMAAAALDTIVLGLALFVSLVLASVLAGLHLNTAHVAAAVAVAVIAYLLHALAPLVDALDGWDVLSPFAWYAGDVVLSEGLTVGHVIAPIAVAVALCAAAVVVLERRDLAAA
jgi:ABC-2 type transport system permease protein